MISGYKCENCDKFHTRKSDIFKCLSCHKEICEICFGSFATCKECAAKVTPEFLEARFEEIYG